MTFLCYTRLSNSIYACMDTLAKTNDKGDFFVEKTFLLPRNHILLCVKGSVNLVFPFLLNIVKMDENGSSREELESYLLEELNGGLPRWKEYPTTVYLLYWKKKKAKVSKITNVESNSFILSRQEILQGKTYSSNDHDIQTDKCQDHLNELTNLYQSLLIVNDTEENEEVKDLIAEFGVNACASHFNDPPDTYTGGEVRIYTLSPESYIERTIYSFPDFDSSKILSFEKILDNLYRDQWD